MEVNGLKGSRTAAILRILGNINFLCLYPHLKAIYSNVLHYLGKWISRLKPKSEDYRSCWWASREQRPGSSALLLLSGRCGRWDSAAACWCHTASCPPCSSECQEESPALCSWGNSPHGLLQTHRAQHEDRGGCWGLKTNQRASFPTQLYVLGRVSRVKHRLISRLQKAFDVGPFDIEVEVTGQQVGQHHGGQQVDGVTRLPVDILSAAGNLRLCRLLIWKVLLLDDHTESAEIRIFLLQLINTRNGSGGG